MSVRGLQWLLASVFVVLGGWCLVAPVSVMKLCFRPQFWSDDPIVLILIGSFGAQALIAAIFCAFARFTATTFPFFVFDAWFYCVTPMLTPIGLLDAVENVVMLAICWLGWRRAGLEARRV